MFSFIETKLFTRLVQEYLSDDEYQELRRFLIQLPEAGNVTDNIPAKVLRQIREEVENG